MLYENTLKRDKDNVLKKITIATTKTPPGILWNNKEKNEVLLFQGFPHILFTSRLKIKEKKKKKEKE